MLREAALLPFLLFPLASVAALGCGGSAIREVACPQGSHRDGSLCVADVVACPEAASSKGGACQPGANPPTGLARSSCRDLAECRADCAKDHVASCTRVGALLQDAGDASADERRRVLTKACDGEDPEGCFRLGLLDDTSDARSTELFAYACERGVAGGCTELGFSLEVGRGTPGVDLPRARELYQRGCDGGHAVGCTNLGVLQAGGEGGARDLPGAVRSFRMGCEGGHARGCTSWGRRLANGDGVPKDEPAAVEAYRRACDGDDGDGCNDLGVRAMEGRGMTKDVALALHLYDKACQRESAVGCLNLARTWLDGRQPGVNEANAIELFYKSCTLAAEDACDELSRTVARLREVCEKGGPNHGSGCLNLGWVVERGLGVEHDVARAVALYKKACSAGVGQGCFNLGVMQAERRGTVREEKAARASFEKGCKLDHAPACARAERR